MSPEKNVSVVILAAGNSGRMAFPKPFLKWNEQFNFIEKIVDTYLSFVCRHIVVVFNVEVYKLYCEKYPANNPNPKLKLVLNEHPEYERFYSLKKGIAVLDNVDFCFVQNIDNPFVNNLILENLYSSLDKNDYYVPAYNGKGGHPVLINKKIIDAINDVDHYNYKLDEFLCKYKKKKVNTEDKTVLFNINTPEEYNKLIKGEG